MSGLAPVSRDGSAHGRAWFPGIRAREPVEWVALPDGADRLGTGGFWAVVHDFGGRGRAWRFARVERVETEPASLPPASSWRVPEPGAWRSSLDRAAYVAGVEAVRSRIREGDVYQVNLCRVLSAPLGPAEPDATALAGRLAAGNPAPFASGVHVPTGGPFPPAWVVSASPELYLRVADGVVASGPIKGTAERPESLTEKDRAENVMITDMVRNDLQRVCVPGSVEVTRLLELQHHPGLVHLVSTVTGTLAGRVDWGALLRATFPPASVSGAPKHTALQVIRALEPVDRGPYCGAVGWVDGDTGEGLLAVGIRTFWWSRDADGTGRLHFGTGAGITWGSDPVREWEETRIKASRLVGLAGGVA